MWYLRVTTQLCDDAETALMEFPCLKIGEMMRSNINRLTDPDGVYAS